MTAPHDRQERERKKIVHSALCAADQHTDAPLWSGLMRMQRVWCFSADSLRSAAALRFLPVSCRFPGVTHH
jgi:hypothetical protein